MLHPDEPAEPRPSHPRPAPGRRTTVPGPRALTGALLVTASVLGLYGAAATAAAPPTHAVVVAVRPLRVGHTVSRGDVAVRRLAVPADVAAAGFSSTDDVVGAVALGPVEPGELVQAGAVRPPDTADDEGSHELSFPIDAAFAAGGTLRPGEQVAVVATYGTGLDAFTETVVARTVVVDVAAATGPLGDQAAVTVRLAVASREEALGVAHAVRVGQVVLVRLPGDGEVPPGEEQPEATSYAPRRGGPADVATESGEETADAAEAQP